MAKIVFEANPKSLCDFQFINKDGDIYRVHKAFIANRCERFETQFSLMRLENVSDTQILAFLRAIYCDPVQQLQYTLPDADSIVLGMWQLAIKFGFTSLIYKCEKWRDEKLKQSSPIPLLLQLYEMDMDETKVSIQTRSVTQEKILSFLLNRHLELPGFLPQMNKQLLFDITKQASTLPILLAKDEKGKLLTISIRETFSTGTASTARTFLVHFIGWGDTYDRHVPVSEIKQWIPCKKVDETNVMCIARNKNGYLLACKEGLVLANTLKTLKNNITIKFVEQTEVEQVQPKDIFVGTLCDYEN